MGGARDFSMLTVFSGRRSYPYTEEVPTISGMHGRISVRHRRICANRCPEISTLDIPCRCFRGLGLGRHAAVRRRSDSIRGTLFLTALFSVGFQGLDQVPHYTTSEFSPKGLRGNVGWWCRPRPRSPAGWNGRSLIRHSWIVVEWSTEASTHHRLVSTKGGLRRGYFRALQYPWNAAKWSTASTSTGPSLVKSILEANSANSSSFEFIFWVHLLVTLIRKIHVQWLLLCWKPWTILLR